MKSLKDIQFNKIYVGMPVTRHRLNGKVVYTKEKRKQVVIDWDGDESWLSCLMHDMLEEIYPDESRMNQ